MVGLGGYLNVVNWAHSSRLIINSVVAPQMVLILHFLFFHSFHYIVEPSHQQAGRNPSGESLGWAEKKFTTEKRAQVHLQAII